MKPGAVQLESFVEALDQQGSLYAVTLGGEVEMARAALEPQV